MNNKIKLFSFLLLTMFGTFTIQAQNVVVRNGVEYLEENDIENDLNSLKETTVALNDNNSKKKAIEVSNKDLKAFVKKKKRLRFRKKRKRTNKCYQEAINDCNNKGKKGK